LRRIVGWAMRARWPMAAGMLPSSGDGSGSRGCGVISMLPLDSRTENAPQWQLCDTPRSLLGASKSFIDKLERLPLALSHDFDQ
jgi:hypothetical protein